LALSVAAFVAVSPARAQLPTTREFERMLDSGRVALTADLNTFIGRAAQLRSREEPRASTAGYVFLQPTALAAVRYREVVFEAALPFAYFHENNTESRDYDRFVLGNPWVGLAYLPDCTCGLSRLSLGMAPDAVQSDSLLERRALALARGAMGDWDGYLWIDDIMPMVAGASTRMDLGLVRLSWDGDLIFGLPTGGREFEFGTQNAGELALVFNWHWQLAGRVQTSYYPTLPGDKFQSSLAFYLRYAMVDNAVGARFVVNLDGPAGFAFTQAGMWGLGLFYSTAL
jgi:hypothetical protein